MSGDALERAKLLSRYGRRIAAGTVLFRDGEPADHAFLIEQGRVRLFKEIGGMERSRHPGGRGTRSHPPSASRPPAARRGRS